MKVYILLLLIFFGGLQMKVSGSQISIQNLNEKYGLAKKRVNCMFQDSKGFVWLGMIDGLYRYDQYNFTPISSRKNRMNSFPEADVRSIVECKPGLLLVGTYDKGLLIYDAEMGRSLKLAGDYTIDLLKLSIKSLYIDKSGTIWVGASNGVYKIKCLGVEDGMFKVHEIPETAFKHLVSYEFVGFHETEPGIIWFATMNDIGFYNTAKNEVKSRPLYYEAIYSFSFLDKKKILIGCFGTGAKTMNTETFNIETLKIKGVSEKSLIRSVYKDRNSNIWMNISNEGLILMESGLNSDNVVNISSNNNQYSDLNSNVIYQISEARDGSIWICGEAGVNVITLKKSYFKSFTDNTFKENAYIQPGIRAIHDSKHGFLWAGTVGGGLKQFDLSTNKFTDVPLISNGKHIGTNIQAIVQDHQGNLWIGTEGEGLIKFYPDKKSGYTKGQVVNFRRYPIPFPAMPIFNDFIMCILQDRNKNIWIGTWVGLSLIEASEVEKTDHSKIIIKNFIKNPNDSLSLSHNTIMSLMEDKEGNIWVGTQGGLNKIAKTPQGYKFIHNYKNKEGKSLNEKRILAVFQSKNGDFWFSNQEGGISRFNPKTGISEDYISDNVFLENTINSIKDDSEGYLWLGSNNGLLKFDPISGSFNIFTSEDGLSSNDFLFGASCKIGNSLYFGLNNGLTYFSPEEIKHESFKPTLIFTELRLFNKPVNLNEEGSPLKHPLNSGETLVLKHNQNFITISFSALDFTLKRNIQYSCKLEGLESSWNLLNAEHKTTYTSIPPGKYTFRVKAASPDDYKNVSEITLYIVINPPIWKTIWAYAIYLIIIILALTQVHKFLINREKQKNALALERLDAKRTHEINLMRLQFFTNISHELRTPLTLLAAPLDSLINENTDKEKAESYYQIMLRNVQRLTRLVDQLLDLRKIEEGYLKLEWQQGDIVEFIRKTCGTFQNYAQKRNMNFSFDADTPELLTYFDSDKLDKILFNLLSNAFKYTEDNGSISVLMNKKSSHEISHVNSTADSYLEIKIIDTGFGIPKDNLSKLFKPFQRVNTNKPIGSGATGIGLSLTKDLIELHKGIIQVDSEVGKGSTFTIYLPVYKNDPSKMYDAQSEELQDKNQLEANPDFPENKDEKINKGEKPVILIIEDSSDLRAYLKSELKSNYKVLEADNGEKGMEIAFRKVPDLVISDVMMPGMDGIELCNRLKKDIRTEQIPVILLTARHSEEAKLSGLEMQADDYITKPFSIKMLKLRIRNLVEQRRKFQPLLSNEEKEEAPQENTMSKADAKFLDKLNQVIDRNLDNPQFDPVTLAKELLTSKMQLYRKVSSLTNQTVFNYIRTYRLNKAAHMIITTDMQFSQIAEAVGYTEASNFTRDFTQQFSQTPTQYVKTKKV
ncbi:MAG TPA: two-component regulator propeller domain-containing protein [Bacteroidales bacterium]|nr:two-component regulator propeller domain-containing protein [Bacteroidales bacterium]